MNLLFGSVQRLFSTRTQEPTRAFRLGAHVASAFVSCALLTFASDVFAQTAPAAELYRRGVSDFQAGRYELACQELADSYRMEELPGVLFTLATCEARAGRVASAAAHFEDFLELAERLPAPQKALQSERVRVAREERAALLPAIPTLTVVAPENLPSDAVVRLDGATMSRASLGDAMPLDPGEHVLTVTLANGASTTRNTSLEKAERKRIELEVPTAADAPKTASASTGDDGFPWVYLAGAVGGAGLATGAVTGLLALNQKSIVDENCEGTDCNATGKAAADTGKSEALASTVGFGVGIVGIAAMVVLHLSEADAPQSRSEVAKGPKLFVSEKGVFVRGAF